MNDEMPQVVGERLRFQRRLGARRLERDDDVAESGGKSIRSDSRENIRLGARKGQNVGRLVATAKSVVQCSHMGIMREEKACLGGAARNDSMTATSGDER